MRKTILNIGGAALAAAAMSLAGVAPTEPRAMPARVELHDPRKSNLSRRARKRLEEIDERQERAMRGPGALYRGAGLSRAISRARAGLSGYKPHGWRP